MDVLSDVLAAVRLTGAIFFYNTFRNPWVAEAPRATRIATNVLPDSQYVMAFHTLLEGSCWAETIDDAVPPLRLHAGDIIAFPGDDAHALCSTVGMRAKPDLAMYYPPFDRQLPYVLNEGDGPEGCRFVCGYVGCDIRPYNPFIKSLPRVLHGRSVATGWLFHLLQHAVSESGRQQSGGEAVLAKLAELMFVEVIRQYVDDLPENATGWLSGLRDPQIGAALKLVHARPAANWSLDRLAREVGMSRTTFASRFTEVVEVPPMQYLGRWRLQLATRRLDNPRLSIAQVAAEAGYESEAAFSRAFKKLVGTPPSAWRRRQATSA
jgi:AraC-like DNA-binding protein